MTQYVDAFLYVEAVKGPTQRIQQWINERVGETGEESYLVTQTIADVAFNSYGSGLLPGIEGTMAGRIFGERAEIRWTQDGALYQAWWLSEKDPKRDGAKRMEYRRKELPNRYYCLGVFDVDRQVGAEKQVYYEKRLSQMRSYPVKARPNDRAYVSVVEYRAAEPAADADLDMIVRQLNQPGIVAYRFVGADADQDPVRQGG